MPTLPLAALILTICRCNHRQHRIIPALRLKHRSGGCGTASALPKCSIMSGCGTHIVLRGAKAPRTLRPLPLLRFAVSATGGAHLCSIQYYLRFWLSICRTSLAVSALRIMRYFHSVSTNAAGFCVKNSWNPQRIPAALCLKSCLCLRNIRHFLCFQIYLKKGYIPQVYLNRIYPYIVMRIEYLVKFTAWRALLWAKSRSTAPRPQ